MFLHLRTLSVVAGTGKWNKYLVPALIFCIIVLISLIAIIAVVSVKSKRGKERPECSTSGCMKAAVIISKSVDLKINPCKDFYEFACGRWITKHRLPETAQRSVFDEHYYTQEQKIKAYLDSPLPNDAPDFMKTLRHIYVTCTKNEFPVGDKKYKTIFENIMNELGGWSIFEKPKQGQTAPANPFNLTNTLIKISHIGMAMEKEKNFLINYKIDIDKGNYVQNQIHVIKPIFTTSNESIYLKYTENDVINEYVSNIVKIVKFFAYRELSTNQETQIKENELKDVLTFEAKLFGFFKTINASAENFLFQIQSLTAISNKEVDLELYFKKVIADFKNVIIKTYFLGKLNDFLKAENVNAIENYIKWTVVKTFYSMVQYHNGTQCLSDVSEYMNIVLASYYVRYRFNNKAKQMTNDIVDYIRTNFISILKESKFADQATTGIAIKKVKTADIQFPFADDLLNDEKIKEYLVNLKIDINGDQSHAENLIVLRKWTQQNLHDSLYNNYARGDWKNTILKIGRALNIWERNLIELSPTYANEPYFHENRPNYLNFAGIGFLIARLFLYSVFSPGNKVDPNLKSGSWFSSNANDNYRSISSCFVEQYNNFSYPGTATKIDGSLTADENVIDNAAVAITHKAYQSWVKDHGTEDYLVSLGFNPKQLFWIGLAYPLCSVYEEKHFDKLLSQKHAPNMIRVIGMIQNSEDFNKDFGCPPKAKMNPEKKCKIF